jgi:hypothetical protein
MCYTIKVPVLNGRKITKQIHFSLIVEVIPANKWQDILMETAG